MQVHVIIGIRVSDLGHRQGVEFVPYITGKIQPFKFNHDINKVTDFTIPVRHQTYNTGKVLDS